MEKAATKAVDLSKRGKFEPAVKLGGEHVALRGAVVDGNARLGTAVSLPPPMPTINVANWLSTIRAPCRVWCDAGWTPMATAKEYQMEASVGGKHLYTGPKTYVSAAGNAYCGSPIRVRACNAGGCSEWSPLFTPARGVYEVD